MTGIDTKETTEIRGAFRRMGCGPGKPLPHPSVQCDFFAEFMRRSEPKAPEGRALEWAERFKRGDQFQFADLENRQILLDIMFEGPGDGTAAHLDKQDVGNFCTRIRKRQAVYSESTHFEG